MERVATHPGIDGDPRIGHGPAIGRLLRTLTAAAALSVAGAMHAAEPPKASVTSPGETAKATALSAAAAKPTAAIEAWIRELDSDEFSVREAATEKAGKWIEREFVLGNARAAAALASLRADGAGKPRVLSLEQATRLTHVEKRHAAMKLDEPTALDPGENVRGDTALLMIHEATGVRIGADDDVLEALSAVDVPLPAERGARLVNDVVALLCARTKTKPRSLPNGDVRLVAAEANETVLASRDVIAVVANDASGKPETMTLDIGIGRGAILAFVDERGGFAGGLSNDYLLPHGTTKPGEERTDGKTGLLIPSNGRPEWTKGSSLNSIHRAAAALDPDKATAVVARDPVTLELSTDGVDKRAGFQSIRMGGVAETENGEWEVTVLSSVFGEIPFPPTPCMWDALTYAAAHANSYHPKDGNGKDMHGTVVETSFSERNMTVRISCPRKPSSVTVRAYAQITPMDLRLPAIPVTPPTPTPLP
jgi:hypothetical protein